MNPADATRIGTITAHSHNRIFAVALDDGAMIDANVKSHTARLMFRIATGDGVRVRLPKADGELALVVEHIRDDPNND